jgi:hypothetical protein
MNRNFLIRIASILVFAVEVFPAPAGQIPNQQKNILPHQFFRKLMADNRLLSKMPT